MMDTMFLCDRLKKTPREIQEMSIDEFDWCMAYYTFKAKKTSNKNNMQTARMAARGQF